MLHSTNLSSYEWNMLAIMKLILIFVKRNILYCPTVRKRDMLMIFSLWSALSVWFIIFYLDGLVQVIVAIICQLDELTLVELSSNPWLFLVFILNQNLERSLLSPNKLIDDDLTLNCLDISEASKIKTRKSQGLLLSCTQVNSSLWQIIATIDWWCNSNQMTMNNSAATKVSVNFSLILLTLRWHFAWIKTSN